MWDKKNIDFHLVPSNDTKQELIQKHSVPSDRIFSTGVPVSDIFKGGRTRETKAESAPKHLLVAGGNNGLCVLQEFMMNPSSAQHFTFTVLCGHNEKLFNMLSDQPNITPLMYIDDREELNAIYDSVDAIITKPGGVTITEVLNKRIPIFIHDYLPGQEEVNLEFLKENKLVYLLNNDHPIEIITAILNDKQEMNDHLVRLHQYLSSISTSVDESLQTLMKINQEDLLIQPSMKQASVSKTILN
ncbi:hypothetical protein [Bacillus sp. Marseille-Q1617]|uniref:hypothetical protein n=1 Tax=Bacillus sp. Marseille-Q1617 TaxID=2736887 RepID=UPI00158BB898|nr:hypothetical protein [Bacillus sp. Marseille-Q1617]